MIVSSRSAPRLTSSSRSPSAAEETEHERLRSQHGAVDRRPAGARRSAPRPRGAAAGGRGAAPPFRRSARPRPSPACTPRTCGIIGARQTAWISGVARLGNWDSSLRRFGRPGRPAHRRSRRNSRRAEEAPNSWPWNSIGVPGPSRRSAVIARSRPGPAIWCTRKPRPELASWSWFWMKVTSCSGAKSSAGVPRGCCCQR